MHQKRLSAPKTYPIKRKKSKFTVSPRPGPHPKNDCIPLLILVRDVFNLAENFKEAKNLINSGNFLVDGKVRKDYKYPVGIFDVISIPKTGEDFIIIPSKRGFGIVKIGKKDAGEKICKIIGKKMVKGGKIQLNLNDGKNILLDKNLHKVGDSLILSLSDLKIKDHLKCEKDSVGMIIKGSNRGQTGKIVDKKITEGSYPNRVVIKIDKKNLEVEENLIFVVGKTKPLIPGVKDE